jgi:dTDP-4-dehydrorhamnose 3,5-epimerase
MTMKPAVPVGSVKFVFFTSPENFREVIIGENFHKLITVPPGIWYGFSGHGRNSSLILNLADTVHNPDEVERKGCATVDFKW